MLNCLGSVFSFLKGRIHIQWPLKMSYLAILFFMRPGLAIYFNGAWISHNTNKSQIREALMQTENDISVISTGEYTEQGNEFWKVS